MLINKELMVLSEEPLVREAPDAGKRILVRKGREYVVIRCEDVAYFYIDNGISYLIEAKTHYKYMMARPLRNIELAVDPKCFFRATKKYLVNINAVVKFRPVKKGKIAVQLHPDPKDPIVISQLKAGEFKRWLVEN
ncbi:MAG: LytTR family transcriptional regulator [Chitinophagaceae bacterium]|nr:LytTR family transcriptional regulator [Chitinophagaceae bacterium]